MGTIWLSTEGTCFDQCSGSMCLPSCSHRGLDPKQFFLNSCRFIARIFFASYSFCMEKISPILLLMISNVFMTFAWYGHLKSLNSKPLWIVILISWGIAFFEYCFQVPGNRLGSQHYTLPQLKILQELITLSVFMGFAYFYMDIKPTMNYLWASLCLLAAVFFIFRS